MSGYIKEYEFKCSVLDALEAERRRDTLLAYSGAVLMEAFVDERWTSWLNTFVTLESVT